MGTQGSSSMVGRTSTDWVAESRAELVVRVAWSKMLIPAILSVLIFWIRALYYSDLHFPLMDSRVLLGSIFTSPLFIKRLPSSTSCISKRAILLLDQSTNGAWMHLLFLHENNFLDEPGKDDFSFWQKSRTPSCTQHTWQWHEPVPPNLQPHKNLKSQWHHHRLIFHFFYL